MSHGSRWRWALACLAGAVCWSSAQATDFVLRDRLTMNTQIGQWEFTIGSVSDVSMWTTSHMGGLNFDPLLTLWNRADNRFVAQGDDISPGTNGFDARIDLAALAAGTYLVTVTASPNSRMGDLLSDGFFYDTREPEEIATWCQPAALQCGAGDLWQMVVTGVDSVKVLPTITPLPPVPEPARALLMLAGLAGVAGWRAAAVRRRSAEVHAAA